MMFSLDWGVIPSCDVDSLDRLRELIEATSRVEGVVGYKVGFTLGLGHSLARVVDVIRTYSDVPVIYDHQKAGTDIPDTAAAFARTVRRAGVTAAIIFPQAGPHTQDAYLREIQAQGMVPVVGAHMTHSAYLAADGGYLTDDAPGRVFRAATEAGVQWFVLPGNQPEAVKHHLALLREAGRPRLLLPGVGAQGGRVELILEATYPTPTYAIVGRSITEAEDPKKVTCALCRTLFRCWRQKHDAGDD